MPQVGGRGGPHKWREPADRWSLDSPAATLGQDGSPEKFQGAGAACTWAGHTMVSPALYSAPPLVSGVAASPSVGDVLGQRHITQQRSVAHPSPRSKPLLQGSIIQLFSPCSLTATHLRHMHAWPCGLQVGDATVPFRPEWDRYRLTPRHTAYLRVAEGCNHACTFCAIPGFRGKFRSKPWAALLDEARRLVESGVVELNLIAEDTNQYGQDRRDGKVRGGLGEGGWCGGGRKWGKREGGWNGVWVAAGVQCCGWGRPLGLQGWGWLAKGHRCLVDGRWCGCKGGQGRCDEASQWAWPARCLSFGSCIVAVGAWGMPGWWGAVGQRPHRRSRHEGRGLRQQQQHVGT